MWLLKKGDSWLLYLFLITFSCTPSCASRNVSAADLAKPRQSRAAESFNPYQLYDRLTRVQPTLQGYFISLTGAFRVIGWVAVTVLWTLSGLSEGYAAISGLSEGYGLDAALDYDYVSRFVNHYTDPQQAGVRIAINFGGQVFGFFILAAFASIGSISDELLERKKRDVDEESIDGLGFNYGEDFEAKDRMDSQCDGVCTLIENVYFVVDRIFSFPFAIIVLSENLVFLAGKTIFWTIFAFLPDPEDIVENLS